MNEKIKFSRPVPPFVRYCAATIPTMFDNSLSYYECLCALWKWIQTNLVDVINHNAAASVELKKQFEELKEFVDHYFDNLDVQEEINNKLDEMAEDGTLAEIIENYIGSSVKFIFPKNYVVESQTGDFAVIKAYGKNILIDSSSALGKTQFYSFLYDNDISEIDYFILSHYDTDHTGNVISLINDGYITENTGIYLPASPSAIRPSGYNDQRQTEAEIKAAITNAGFTYTEPNEGEQISFDNNFNITFLNCDVSQLIIANYSDYNDCSMFALINHYNNKALYTGDAGGRPLQRLYTEGLIVDKLQLFKVPHHASSTIGDSAMSWKFLETTMPKYAFVPLNSYKHSQNYGSASSTFSWLKDNGCETYGQFVSTINTIFESTKFGFNVIQGTPLPNLSNVRILQKIYVDSSAGTTGDGTESKPIKDLPTALGMCESGNAFTEIYLADGEYGFASGSSNVDLSRCDRCNIRIHGNSEDNTAVVIKTGFNIRVMNFEILDCTIKADSGQAFYFVKSTARINNCIIKSSDGITDKDGVFASESNVTFINTAFQNLDYGVSSHNDNLTFINCSFTSCKPILANGSVINMTGDTAFTTLTSTNNKVIEKSTNENIINFNYTQAYNGDTVTSGNVTITKDFRYYNKARIVTGTPSEGTWFESEICAFNNTSFGSNIYAFMTADGVGTITFNTSNPTTAAISSPTKLRLIYFKIDETGRK